MITVYERESSTFFISRDYPIVFRMQVNHEEVCNIFWGGDKVWVDSFGKVLRSNSYYTDALKTIPCNQPTSVSVDKFLNDNESEWKLDIDKSCNFANYRIGIVIDKMIEDYNEKSKSHKNNFVQKIVKTQVADLPLEFPQDSMQSFIRIDMVKWGIKFHIRMKILWIFILYMRNGLGNKKRFECFIKLYKKT